MPRVFVVSPLPAVRAGLRALIAAAADLPVVGESGQLASVPASRLALEPLPDVIVLDGSAVLDSGAIASELPEREPGLVILGPVPGDERLPLDLGGRAWAYLPREVSGEPLVAAVRAVASGLTVIDPLLGQHLFARADVPVATPATEAAGEELTTREREVLQLVAVGLGNKTIAQRLGISEHTVKFHVAAILAKLGASSRTEAVHLGARRGLVAL